jgi:hypothetical protein
MSEPVALFKNYEILSGITLLIVSEFLARLERAFRLICERQLLGWPWVDRYRFR